MKGILKCLVLLGIGLPASAEPVMNNVENGSFFDGQADDILYQFPTGGSDCTTGRPTNSCTNTTWGEKFRFTLQAPSEVHILFDSSMSIRIGQEGFYNPEASPTSTLPDGTRSFVKLLPPGSFIITLLSATEVSGCNCYPIPPVPRNYSLSVGWSTLTTDDLRDPNVVLKTFTDQYWRKGSVPELAEAPDLIPSLTSLNLSTDAGSPRFGYLETAESMVPLPAGSYAIRFRLSVAERDESPDIRVRVFTDDGLYQAIASTAKGRFGPSEADRQERMISVLWESDGLTQWRVATDLLAFRPDQQGTATISSITIIPLSE